MPPKFHCLDIPKRYKIFYGGRGAGKSWQLARKAIERAHQRKQLILCTRLMQTSIKDSVHRLLVSQIEAMGLREYFKITEHSIKHLLTGSEFIFKGLHHHPEEIKSLEGVNIVWVAEAQNVGFDAWEVLSPTIRQEDSEIWVEFNTNAEDDETYVRFITNRRPDAIVTKVNYTDNPHFPAVLERERQYDFGRIAMARDDNERAVLQAIYDHKWLGDIKRIKDAAVFRGKTLVHNFDTPQGSTFYHGADWGFSQDPTVLLRMFITKVSEQDDPAAHAAGKEDLWIDSEAFGYQTELPDLPALFDQIDTARKWPILADNSRPETISYMGHQGFSISAARKWPNSIEDGVEHLRGFRMIHIHQENCPQMAQEARDYCYKVDKNTKKILPVIIDANNHGWDSARYGLDGFIEHRGGLGTWLKLAND